MLTLSISGSISDFSDNDKLELQQKVAEAAGVDKSLVAIRVAAASMRVTAIIAVPASMTADEVQTSLSSTLGTADAASTALGLTVEEVPTTTTVALAEPPSTPTPPSTPFIEATADAFALIGVGSTGLTTSSGSTGADMAFIGVGIGALLFVVFLFIATVFRARKKFRPTQLILPSYQPPVLVRSTESTETASPFSAQQRSVLSGIETPASSAMRWLIDQEDCTFDN